MFMECVRAYVCVLIFVCVSMSVLASVCVWHQERELTSVISLADEGTLTSSSPGRLNDQTHKGESIPAGPLNTGPPHRGVRRERERTTVEPTWRLHNPRETSAAMIVFQVLSTRGTFQRH